MRKDFPALNNVRLIPGTVYTFRYEYKDSIGEFIKYEFRSSGTLLHFKWADRYKTFFWTKTYNVKKVGFFSFLLNFFLGHLSERDI